MVSECRPLASLDHFVAESLGLAHLFKIYVIICLFQCFQTLGCRSVASLAENLGSADLAGPSEIVNVPQYKK